MDKIQITALNLTGNRLLFKTETKVNGLKPSGQMLVDSDGLAFIYLMENEESYTYIVLPEPIWDSLKVGLNEKRPVFISDGQEELELHNFKEELEYLISNIKGNSNYGEEMVTKVENTF
ncbi:MAG: hypothetical protein Q8906_14405 [Bacillota bacterium]|nr:hypothetical protein [Bacillota bacterium]MDP4171800.1 hypothetical protein [Bacillota bacterium]